MSVAERRIHSSGTTHTIVFTRDGKRLISGGQGVQVWGLQDGQQLATLGKEGHDVRCLAVSNDGQWIAAGTRRGVHVWGVGTRDEQLHFGRHVQVNTVDFSPDSKQLITASQDDTGTAIVWDATTWRRLRTLKHDDSVVAATYSPEGDRIATIIPQNLRIWDSKNGSLLVDVPVQCDHNSWCSLTWSINHIFVVSSGMVAGLEPSTGFTVSVQVVPSSRSSACALPQHGMFFAYCVEKIVTICDTSTSTTLGVIQHDENIRSISFSPDNQFIGLVGESGVVFLKHLSTVFERNLLGNSSSRGQPLTEWVTSMLTRSSWNDILTSLADHKPLVPLRFVLYRAICEHLERRNSVVDAVECFNQMQNDAALKTNGNDEQTRWAVAFRQRFLRKLPSLGDAAMSAQQSDEAIARYTAALSLKPAFRKDVLVKRSQAYMAKGSWEDALNDTNQVIELDRQSSWNHESVLREWIKVKLTDGPWGDTLAAASNFKVPMFTVYRTLYEYLEAVGRTMDANECLDEMIYELEKEIESKEANLFFSDLLSLHHKLCRSGRSVLEFESRSCKALEDLGDDAMAANQYEKASSFYSVALGLNPPSPQTLFAKRSKVYAARGVWEDALRDANKAVTLDPASLAGHQQKCLALREVGRPQEAIYALETMLMKMSESPDMDDREHYNQFRNSRAVIRRAIQGALRDLPPMLIDTASGRLCTRRDQASAFELSPVCMEIAMSAPIDYDSIKQEVAQYYRYAIFSHKQEDYEPLFERVNLVSVYNLETFPTHDKLQMFCKIARDAGFHWAWSETCCINKADHLALQEALVSMFNWYRRSSLTVVYLRGVFSESPHRQDNLGGRIWKSHIWMLQEYHASGVVRLYSEDWTPYGDFDAPNHKECPEIISEMEQITAGTLAVLQPGLDYVREKLSLASQCETAVQEDATYALFRLFSVSFPIVYGERDYALGQLLALLLASSGDTSMLAWTGESGSFNSCLPTSLSVFGGPSTTHIPPVTLIDVAEIETVAAKLQAPHNMPELKKLYAELLKLSAPLFSGKRMRLPCIAFGLGRVSATLDASEESEHVFHVTTSSLGPVKIRTKEDLSRLESLILVHPWIDFLLDRRPMEDIGAIDESAPSPSPMPNVEARALQFLSRLRKPFGGLLLTPTRRNMEEYRRVAADCSVMVQIQEDPPFNELVSNVCTLDVL